MTRVERAVNRLAKWRSILTGWQLGTRSSDDPVSQAVRDHREVTLILRAEVTALAALLIKHGVFTSDEFGDQLTVECEHLERAMEKKFPGARASDDGMILDPQRIGEWMSKFPQ